MATADLTPARLRELFHYDPETGVFTRLVTRSARAKAGMKAGSINDQGYLLIMIDGRVHSAHRLAWFYMHGEFPQGDIDHMNGVRSDNRLGNLRHGNRSFNMQNERRARASGSSGFLGVTWSRKDKKWVAQIMLSGKHIYLGGYDSPEVAHAAYLEAKRRLHPGNLL